MDYTLSTFSGGVSHVGQGFVECLGSWFLLGEQGLMYMMVIDYFYSVSHIFKMLFHQLRNLASCFRNALVFYCIVFLTFFLQHIVCRGAKTPHFKNKPPILGKRPFLKIPDPPLFSRQNFQVTYNLQLSLLQLTRRNHDKSVIAIPQSLRE